MIILQAQLDDIKERERNWAITEDSADKIAGVETLGVKQPPNVSASSFVSEQNQKAAALERMRKDQEERLRSLSSPLPVAINSSRQKSRQRSCLSYFNTVSAANSLSSFLAHVLIIDLYSLYCFHFP